ncbi:hypothetical protein DYP60_03630 [Sphaerochaeta halotolerans]|jgi:hypothetical protein|uniref:Uncharacterized protein n=1 Tax=Sphaerochaeta halotolerans TaxID=2293840 RepID=A0A372MJT0_9SPIR|nr:hypothetical protein [Sphaerochaeta halotolerans]RFU95576.1 hypothetical protein DYP60_03630 [Sphaerochaeta halotolerans]
MKRTVLFTLLCIFLVPIFGSTTLGGSSGYIVVPSAEVAPSEVHSSVTTAYSATITSGKVIHIPSILLSFSDTVESSFAVDIGNDIDLLLNGKWRFTKRETTSFAAGVLAQVSGVSNTNKLSAQLYVASTFASSIMDLPSKTTLRLGYTFKKPMTSNIDFALGFQTPFFPEVFKEKVDFLLDFGNVSYSTTPSAGNAGDRGLVNVALRLLPVEFLTATYFGLDIRALDLFDHEGRALSIGATISFRPQLQ